ncbi:TRAP transporter large permease [Moorellaceae bacterium AZ2]
MSLVAIGIAGLAICFLLIFLGMPIYVAFTGVGFVGLWLVRGLKAALGSLGSMPYSTACNYTWSVVPLFVWMGYIVFYSDIAEEFFDGVRRWIGHVRGGLAHAVVVGNAIFGACCGNPIAAAVTFAAMCLPEMRRYGYNDKLTLGAVASAGLLSALIPPSMPFIIYGAVTETSIGKLFIAGVVPGLVLTALFMVTVYLWCVKDPQVGPPGPRATWGQRLRAGAGMWTIVVVMLVIIGGIFIGLFTPTEAGAAGAAIVLLISLLRRKLNWQGFKKSLVETGLNTGMVGMLLVGTMLFNTFLVATGVPKVIGRAIIAVSQGDPIIFMFISVIVLLIMGMFMDAIPILLLTIPILHPVALSLGIDPLHYSIVVNIALLLGTLTPPFGIVVYAVQSSVKDVPLVDVFRGTFPFIAAGLVMQILVIFFPALSTWLPGLMLGK